MSEQHQGPSGLTSPVEQQQQETKPDEEKLQKSVLAARKVIQAQDAAADLKARAQAAVNPKERLALLQQAYDKEIEAWGQSKYAQRLQSGAWQGTVAGGGIGGAVALGLGTVVGTLVGGLVAVPTVALGSLVGAGVGVFHGPWLKFGKKGEGDESTTSAAMEEAKRLDDAVEKGASYVPQRPRLDEADSPANPMGHETSEESRRRPRKLQVRSHNIVDAAVPEKRRPRKLQVRSTGETCDSG